MDDYLYRAFNSWCDSHLLADNREDEALRERMLERLHSDPEYYADKGFVALRNTCES